MSVLPQGDLNIPVPHSPHMTSQFNNTDNSDYTQTDNESINSRRITAEHLVNLHNSRHHRARVGNNFIGLRIGQHGNESNTGSDATSPSNQSVEMERAVINVINISNDIDTEKDCNIIKQMVRQCIRSQIWVHNKFLTDQIIKNMTITDRDNPNTIINLLLARTRKTNYSDAHRFRFWKKYGSLVQKELNTINTVCTRSIKNFLMRGKINLTTC